MNAEQERLALEILSKSLDITVATNRADGWPQATTVSFVSDGLTLYFGTWSRSQKAANITRDGRVSVTADAPYTNWEGIRSLSMAARAEFVTDAVELARVGEGGPDFLPRRLDDARQREIERGIHGVVHLHLSFLAGFVTKASSRSVRASQTLRWVASQASAALSAFF